MASVEQRSWSWSGEGNTAAAARRAAPAMLWLSTSADFTRFRRNHHVALPYIYIATQQYIPTLPGHPANRRATIGARMIPILLANIVSRAITRAQPAPEARPPGRGSKGRRKRINLALQGGGAHGAFTWGVLDQLLDDGRLEIEGISGASAGAVNAIMLADGLARGGPDEARTAAGRFLARGERRRPPAGPAARRGRAAAFRSCATACGSARCRACSRRTSSTRSTSIRSRT